MSAWEWFCSKCENVSIIGSNIEEHNRYRKAPKGVSTEDWGLTLFRLKYDFRQSDEQPRYKGDKEIK